jgi:hypothetical protein
MGLSIQVRVDNQAIVVTLAGIADIAMLEPLFEPLGTTLAKHTVVVLDVDDLTLDEPNALPTLVVKLLEIGLGGQLRITAGDDSPITTLRRAGIDHRVAVYRSVSDALTDVGPRERNDLRR